MAEIQKILYDIQGNKINQETSAAAVKLADAGGKFTATNVEAALLETANIVSTKFGEIVTINVKDYGATGDGATEDTTAIANAITALPAGGVLFFPIGTYLVNNVALKSDMVVKGNGNGSIIKLKNSAIGNCLTANTISNVLIKDIQLDGNRLNNATTGPSADEHYDGIGIFTSSDITVDNVWSHSNGYHGCIITNSQRIKVRNSKFTDNGYRPFHGHNSVIDCECINNYCSDNGKGFANQAGDAWDGIYFFDGIDNLLIEGNEVITSNRVACISVGGKVTGLVGSKNIIINNNICKANSALTDGILLIGTDLNYVNITNNIISDGKIGIAGSHDYTLLGKYFTISGNIIKGNSSFGMDLYAVISYATIDGNMISLNAGGGIYTRALTDSIISNNVLVDNGAETPANDAINLTSTARVVVVGNKIVNSTAGKYQVYGVNEVSGCLADFITSNSFMNMTTAATNITGTGSVAKSNMVGNAWVA